MHVIIVINAANQINKIQVYSITSDSNKNLSDLQIKKEEHAIN